MTRVVAVACAAVVFGGVLAAQAPVLDIKLGLWENSVTMNMGGLPAGIDTSKMTPEQKAQMGAAAAAMSGQPITQKTCLKKEDFQSDAFMANQPPGMKCKSTIVTNTRTEYVADIACTGAQPMTGRVSIQAASNAAFKGTMQMTSTGRGGMNMNMAMSGKWLSADCGAVK